jgi:hypothetical protein
MSALLDAVGTEYCGLLLDLGNFDALSDALRAFVTQVPDRDPAKLAALFDGLDLSSLYAGIDALAPYAELVSLKAHVVGEDGTVGVVDIPRAIGILAEHGYLGGYSVEWEGEGGDPWAKARRVAEVGREAALAAGAARS